MVKASYQRYILNFKQPAGTSRGVLNQKETWFITLEENGKKGIGECGILRGLSIDDRPDFEDKLIWTCQNIHLGVDQLWNQLIEFPSIQFGVEMAFKSLSSENPFVLFPSKFTENKSSIPINGLIWMGDPSFMSRQIEEKIANGFSCVKLKIGAINFDEELAILRDIRQNFTANDIEIRVDANGAFSPSNALYKLEQLSEFKIHSIEQPIAINQHDIMSALCKTSKIPIALDEELIGLFESDKKDELLRKIKPQYLILKPSFIGGFKGTSEWIALAEKHNIGWWITSALESNIGLNAIAQFTFLQQNSLPQGLGTGSLYTNNIKSPLEVKNGALYYNTKLHWQMLL